MKEEFKNPEALMVEGFLDIDGCAAEEEKGGFLLIAAYGRSGSTLLMNIVNACPECLIRGENGNALYPLYESWRRVESNRNVRGRNSSLPSSPWAGIDDVDSKNYFRELMAAFVRNVIRPSAENKLIGFKEVRYSEKEVPDINLYIPFLMDNVPNFKVVFNHRNPADVARSKWWADIPNAQKIIEDIDDRFYEFQPSDSVFHFNYNQALSSRKHIFELLKFLGVSYRVKDIEAVLARKHSY